MSKPPRKLRKACSLPSCSGLPGQCMHCACDGRCGIHAAGRCGSRREGNGRACKRPGCSRDDRCVHSNRATCCHCRNLVTTNGRAARLASASAASSAGPSAVVRKRALPSAPSPPAVPTAKKPRAELEADAELAELLLRPGAAAALCEWPQWRARRPLCNLVVLVAGAQFNLHKHPVLLESALLRRLARPLAAAGQSAPVLRLDALPGGAAAFERLCVFMYAGELLLDPASTLAAAVDLVRAALRLELRAAAAVRDRVLAFLRAQRLADDAAAVEDMVSAVRLGHEEPGCEPLVDAVVDAAAARLMARPSAAATAQLLALPSARFVQLTQQLVRTAPDRVLDAVCVQAQLAQLHRSAAEGVAAVDTVALECMRLLRLAGHADAADADVDAADRFLWRMILEGDEAAAVDASAAAVDSVDVDVCGAAFVPDTVLSEQLTAGFVV